MKIQLENVKPMEIEKRSFEIIGQELKEQGKILQPDTELIVKRCIHTSADFDYADNLAVFPGSGGTGSRGHPGGSGYCDGYPDGKSGDQ